MATRRRGIRPLIVLGGLVAGVWAWREAALRRDEARIAAITPDPPAPTPPQRTINGVSANGG
ncbi:MAG TPA: hypothetical protein VK866_10525 [Acidimicrobiales bacterium]|nr:hypothetical protein [Acidimicrobiales bacterium]